MIWLLGVLIVWGVPVLVVALALIWAAVHPVEDDPVLEGYEPGPWTPEDDEALEQLLADHAERRAS
jgi:hypothetical protein